LLLTLDGDELGIIEAAATFLEGAIPLARLHRGEPAVDLTHDTRKQIAEMGWFAITLGAEHGGSGLSGIEHVLFHREVGRRCGAIDILATSLAVLIAPAGAIRDELMAGGASIAAAVADGERLRILGSADAKMAVHISGDESRLIDLAGVSFEARPSLDPSVSMRVLHPAGIRVSAVSLDPTVPRLARLGVAAMLVGVAERALELIVEYAKVRHTFGRPIGAYQAVRHPCADMALRAEAARCQLWFAAAAMKEGRRDMDAHIDAAKHLANEAAVTNADVDIQLHGGIGVTDEHDAHLLLKHALLLSRLFGSKRTLLSRLLNASVED
jgi:alkylation response protein AidB-like acyl-CoA dehydrogenase